MQKLDAQPLKLILIPYWLQQLLTAHGCELSAVLDDVKLKNILSSSDFSIYTEAQYNMADWVPDCAMGEEVHVTTDRSEEEKNKDTCRYLYGELADPQGCNLTPEFEVCRIGYDTLGLTVNPEGHYNLKDLMGTLIAEWRATNPLEQLARHTLFSRYLQLL